MINLEFSLSNPFASRWDSGYYKDRQFSKTKAGEIQIWKDTNIIHFGFRLNFRTDHAGITVQLGALGTVVSLQFYDTRHWDYENNKWHEYDYNDWKRDEK